VLIVTMNATEVIHVTEAIFAPILSYLGAMFAIALSGFGAAIGIAKLGSWILSLDSSDKPHLSEMQPMLTPRPVPSGGMRYFVGIIIASMPAIYGLIVSVLITSHHGELTIATASKHLAAGLAVGLAGLASGWSIGNITPTSPNTPFVRLVLLWVYAEAIGLYGLIVAILCFQ